MACHNRTILVTGFGAFPGVHTNPTAAILRELERHRQRLQRLGIALHACLLPVHYADAADTLRVAVAACRPDMILHLGVAARRKAISIETRAVNRAGPLRPDAMRRSPGQILEPGAAARLRARIPAARMLAAIRAGGQAAALSIDAGDYVCNATLYRSLLWRLAPHVGFIHVPSARASAQPTRRGGRGKPTIDALSRAIFSALLVVARDMQPGPREPGSDPPGGAASANL